MLDRILVVDDEPVVLEVLGDVLAREGFQVSQAGEGRGALELLQREPHELVLCDMRMPGMDGFGLLKEVGRAHPGTDVVIMTGYGSLDGALDAMSLGAADYLIKPLNPKEVVARIRSILQRRRLEAQLHSLQSELRSRYDRHNLVAASPRMQAVAAALTRIASSEEPVLVCGETGTGRRFVARTLHHVGPRREGPYEELACDVSPPDEVLPQLCGARPEGQRLRRGRLERLRGGALHLYKVEHLAPDAQRWLARVLATRSWTRVGQTDPMDLGARLIVSLTGTLDELLEAGRLVPELSLLRELVSLHLPRLRDRREDVPGLVSAFLDHYALEHGRSLQIQPESVELLQRQEFPGNVRQLFVTLGHCAVLSQDGQLSPEIVERSLRQADMRGDHATKPIADHLGDREYQIVLRAVQRHPRRLDEAARELGVSRTTLWRRMRKYNIRVPSS